MANIIGYYVEEGYTYYVYDTDTTEMLGEQQDKVYMETMINDVFEEDKKIKI